METRRSAARSHKAPTDWKAGCGRSASPVWKEGGGDPLSLPLSSQFLAREVIPISSGALCPAPPEIFISRHGILRHDAFMGKRREARERAVQFLFQHDLNTPDNLELELATFWNSQRTAAIEDEKSASTWGEKVELPPPTAEETETRNFAEPLIKGVIQHRDEIDERIKKYCQNWDFHRIAAVDRNVMRLAIYEILHRDDIPPVVSINEAVDIAKKFSTEDSGKFVNGILDKVRAEVLRPARGAQ
jgi:N utilization substance protein B